MINGAFTVRRLDTSSIGVRDRRTAAEKNELRLLSEHNSGQDDSTEYNLTLPEVNTDPIYEVKDKSFTDQLNI